MKPPLIIYHGNCADGFAAAWCFWSKYGDAAEYLPAIYQTTPPPAPETIAGRDVFLVDFSFKRDTVAALLPHAASVTLIDHHKSALEDLRGLVGLQQFADMERSGATLAWDYLFPNTPRPRLLEHIEDRDLWRFQLPCTREIQAALFSYEYDFQLWDYLIDGGEAILAQMAMQGAAIERKHYKDIAELLTVCKRRLLIGGHDVPVACLPYTMVSDAAGAMAKGEPFAACYWDTADGRAFGLRSAPEGLDVSEIALIYGGGGHRRAAGFKVPRWHGLAQK